MYTRQIPQHENGHSNYNNITANLPENLFKRAPQQRAIYLYVIIIGVLNRPRRAMCISELGLIRV